MTQTIRRIITDPNSGLLTASAVLGLSILLLMAPAQGADVLIPSDHIQRDTGTDYFIISIGVNTYQDRFWPALKWPASDASKIATHLGQNTSYPVHKYLLVDDQAHLDNIYKTLSEVARQADATDTVIIYISSHGTLAQNSSGTLDPVTVVHDTNNNQLHTTGLLHSTLQKWLDGLTARKKLLIFATCHSGEGKSQLPQSVLKLVRSRKGKLTPLADASEGTLVLAAAAQGEAAHEDDHLQGDIYTYFLVEALATYDRNHDGMVSALEAHDYAKEQTWVYTQGRQRPTAHARFIGDADINLFGRKLRSGLPVLEAYDSRLAGFQLQVDGKAKGTLPFAFPLNPEGSRVSLYAPNSNKPLGNYFVSAGSGATLSLEQVMTERPVDFIIRHHRHLWQDKLWRRLTGDAYSMTNAMGAGYAIGRFGASVTGEYMLPTKQRISDAVDARTKLRSHLLQLNYRHPLDRFAVTGTVEAGREHIEIKLSDQTTGDTLRFKEAAWSRGVQLALSYEFGFDLSLIVDAGMKKTQWQFDRIFKLDGSRRWLGIGMEYRFGWRARSLQ